MLGKIRRNKIKFAIAALAFIAIVLLWAFFIWQEEIFALLKSFSVWLKGELSLLNKAPLILFPIAILILPRFLYLKVRQLTDIGQKAVCHG